MLTRVRAALAAALFLLACGPTLAADNYVVKDGTGATITIKSKDIGGGVQSPQFIPSDPSGNPLGQTVLGSQEQDVLGSGTLNATSTSSTIDIPVNGQSTLGLRFAGLAASGATVSYFQTIDGTTYTAMNETNTGTGALSPTRTTDGQVRLNVAGRKGVRLQISTAGTGTVSVAWLVSVRPFGMALDAPLPAGANVVGKFGALGSDGATARDLRTTTTGALEPATAAAGKITRTSTALSANASTTIAAANANRVALGLQCGSGGVSVDETGGALTAAGVGNGTVFLPTNASSPPYFTPPIATLTAVTAYTATAQTCVVTEYLR